MTRNVYSSAFHLAGFAQANFDFSTPLSVFVHGGRLDARKGIALHGEHRTGHISVRRGSAHSGENT